MDHQPTDREKSESPPPATKATTNSVNGIKESLPEGIPGLGIPGFNVMATGLTGTPPGISSEDYQQFIKMRQHINGVNELLAAQQHQLQLLHYRQLLQSQHDRQNVAKSHIRQQLEEQHHNDLMNQVRNKDKSAESANASTAVKRHLQNFVISRRNKTFDGYPNNNRGLRWTPSLDRNGIHDLAAPYPHIFDKKNSFPLRKTASEPNLKVKSKLRHKVANERKCSPLLSRHGAGSRPDVNEHIKRKINNDQGNGDNSASNSAPNSGPSSPLSSNSNINNSSAGSGNTPASIGLIATGSENPNALLGGAPHGVLIGYPETELHRMALNRTASLPSPFMQQGQTQPLAYKPMPLDIVQHMILQQQLAGVSGMGVPSEKDTPGPIRHIPQARPHKALSRTHSAPTTIALQQHLKRRLLMQQQQQQQSHKHAPNFISGLSAEPPYRPLATHREASERAEAPVATHSSSKSRKQKLAASPPPTHPSAISTTTVQALQSHLNKHNTNKCFSQFPKQTDARNSPPSARHSSMDHSTTPEKSSRSHTVMKQPSSGDEQDMIIVKRELPDIADELSSYPSPARHQLPTSMVTQDTVGPTSVQKMKPSPLQARRSLLEGEIGSHKPLTRTQSSPAVSFSQKLKHKKYRYTTGLAYDPVMLQHGCACGDAHAEHAGRLREVWSRLTQVGLTEKCETIEARKATMEELQLAHTQEHTIRYGATPLARQQSDVSDKFIVLPCGGVGVDNGIDIDTVWNEQNTINAARMAVGLTVDMAMSVAADELKNGFAVVRPPGHHAEKDLAMAFCYFNSVAIAARQLQRMYPDKIRRILIVDWDVHHCNGTQNIFYDDDSVLVISIHRFDEGNFFPGTGAPDETGCGPGVGFNVNIGFSGGLDPPIGDADYLSAFRSVIMPIAEEFKPDFVFISAGFSAAKGHPSALGGYSVTPQCFSYLTKMLSQLAKGKLVMILEGGFELKPLCDCVEICVRTLLGDPQDKETSVGDMPESSLKSTPCENAVRSINKISRYQERYWCKLKRMSAYINVSHAAYLGQDPEDRACVAIASLTVEHPKHVDSKAKLREVLTKGQKSPKQDAKSSQNMNNVSIDGEEPRLTIVTDDTDEMHSQNHDEEMSAESSPLDVVGLSSSSSGSPAPSPNNIPAFISPDTSKELSHGHVDKTVNMSIEEPMEDDSELNSNSET